MPKRRLVARLLIAAAAYLAVGAVVTLLVAWCLVLVNSDVMEGYRVEVASWPGQAPSGFPVRPNTGKEARRIGWRVSTFDAEEDRNYWHALRLQAGWPALALRRDRFVQVAGSTTERGAGLPAPAFLRRDDYLTSERLPIGLSFSGFLLDSAFYAAFFLALVVGLRHRVRVRRHRRGLCPACGYSRAGLAGDAACPECGAVNTKSKPPPFGAATSAGSGGRCGRVTCAAGSPAPASAAAE